MDIASFRTTQEPFKERYRKDARAAFLALKATGTANDTTTTNDAKSR